MPKKRHHPNYPTKPQSTAPASLSSSSNTSSSSRHADAPGNRTVNELLAGLRRVNVIADGAASQSLSPTPSVPPGLRHILNLPEIAPPPPRRGARVDSSGRRLPPGPAAPRSWLAQSRHATGQASLGAGRGGSLRENPDSRVLPGSHAPAPGSLVDIALRKLVQDWEFQKSYNRYYLYALPTHIRGALITYLGVWYEAGVSVADLRLLLLPPPEEELGDDLRLPSPSSMNEHLFHLDLKEAVGRSLKLRELSDLLFPSAAGDADGPQESWDAAEPGAVPRPLVPNLTHLSLALNPEFSSGGSWKQLLSFASNLHSITHLSLAYWPEPSLTPNAKYVSVVSQQGQTVQYGGTGPYSHSLDDDWLEAVMLLRKLSKSLYELEYLDLTGCASWFTALMVSVDNRTIDWVGDWGKVTTLLLYPGYKLDEDAGILETSNYQDSLRLAKRIERHIRSCRAGRGRIISVETDKIGDASI